MKGFVASLAARSDGKLASDIAKLVAELGAGDRELLISGATGAHLPTRAEHEALANHALRGFTAVTGHLKEAQLPFAVALAALAHGWGSATEYLWADDRHLSGTGQASLGSLALARAQNNPF